MTSYENTQLSNALEFDSANIVFQEPQLNSITLGDGKTKINYYRIPVGVRNPDGTLGELVFPTEKVFSFGVQENKNMESDRIDGYSMALCMWNRDGATPEQKKWIETFSQAIERCKEHVVDIKEDIEKYDLEMSDLKKFNPLYYSKWTKISNIKTNFSITPLMTTAPTSGSYYTTIIPSTAILDSSNKSWFGSTLIQAFSIY